VKEALFWELTAEGKVRCRLCPHECRIDRGRSGICGVRRNVEGKLYAASYAAVTSEAMDPIEKKPLYHFHPGTSFYSIGSYGCNFKCPFCQNWRISQQEAPTRRLTPEEAVKTALEHGAAGIAYTYNEPMIWAEYVLDTAAAAHEAGLVNVMVTNGFVNPQPLEAVLEHVDALNIDLKAFTEDFYTRLCKGRLAPVLAAAELAASRAHVELTNLVIPGENDSAEQFDAMAQWVAEKLGPATPVHLSAYIPRYRFTAPPTDVETLLRAKSIFDDYLQYVYLGNVISQVGSDTFCTGCGALLISRAGYAVRITGLTGPKCAACGADNNIVR